MSGWVGGVGGGVGAHVCVYECYGVWMATCVQIILLYGDDFALVWCMILRTWAYLRECVNGHGWEWL